jgi:predicted SprT family Zn-dependent metalloprotease
MPRFDREDIELLASYFFETFLPIFQDQPEGTIQSGTIIEISRRMTSKIGLALLFENKIRLSESYFLEHPHYLPYTIFHEMTHLWLYHGGHDPGHTRRFYRKMLEFESTGYLVDPEVHIHTRLAAEAKYIYSCLNCGNRWHLRDTLEEEIFCGLCWRHERQQHFAALTHTLSSSPPLVSNKDDLECA